MDALHIWLRAETKPNEQRRALTPDKCRLLVERGFQVTVEYSDQCAFKNEEFHCVPGVHMVPCGSWVGAPKDAYILGLKELPFCMDPISNRHIFFAHAYKYQTGWENLLLRFIKGGGSILDIEFMTDENGRRVVAEFSSMAGLGGMGLGILAWCHQQISPGKPVPAVKPYSSEAAFIDHIRIELKQVAKLKGVPEVCPRVIVIGALGRCGKGAIKMAHKVGIPESAIAKWDLDETKGGGPFKEILEYDILVNCILLMEEIPPFVTKDMLESEGSSNRPVDVCAIDHFPSVLHRESSERFANRMTPYLLNLPEDPVWVRTRQMFERKAEEAQNVLEK
ncbi:uncharacterized protein [Montipora capricornis]|uniref:uncharacterized protein isoform X2 n=1 Tax=Montipora capricornis TaxID=246305 RepID=UPI0035F13A96